MVEVFEPASTWGNNNNSNNNNNNNVVAGYGRGRVEMGNELKYLLGHGSGRRLYHIWKSVLFEGEEGRKVMTLSLYNGT
jgi:hypothetical protein